MKPDRGLLTLLTIFMALFALAAKPAQLTCTVVSIAPRFGNIDTSIGPKDLASLGIKRGDTFQVGFSGKRFDVYLGETYSDVPKGDWVAFMTAKGRLRIARNFDNAAQTLGVKQGDSITLYH